jgi:uncharacterized membrane-anchored protein
MINIPGKYWALLALVAAAQTAALLKMVFDRETILKSGREIEMAVLPVDPRDLLRGDFVRLGYGLSPITMSDQSNGNSLAGVVRGRPVYVTIHEGADKTWNATKLSAAYPAEVAASDAVLKGVVESRWDGAKLGEVNFMVKYGIESYFVPEGTGKPIEDSVREKKAIAVVAVAQDGTAAIKGLIVGGERHEDPPLF